MKLKPIKTRTSWDEGTIGIYEWRSRNKYYEWNDINNSHTKCHYRAEIGGYRMIRIVIAEDQGMLLGSLGSLLDLEDDMEVVGKAKNEQAALAVVKEYKSSAACPFFALPTT